LRDPKLRDAEVVVEVDADAVLPWLELEAGVEVGKNDAALLEEA